MNVIEESDECTKGGDDLLNWAEEERSLELSQGVHAKGGSTSRNFHPSRLLCLFTMTASLFLTFTCF